MSTQRTLVTVEQLPEISARLSADGGRCELVRGELVKMAPAGRTHGRIANTIAFILTSHVRRHDLGEVYAAETGFILRRSPDTVRAPDASFVSKERLGEEEAPGYLELAPDFAVKVVSPSDSASMVQAKVEDWLKAGTRLVWVVYPATRSVTVYRSLQEALVLSEDDALDGAPVFEGFSIRVMELFR